MSANVQQKYIRLAAKSVSLFCIASVSSFLSPILTVLFAYGIVGLELGTVGSLDLMINILCLYLQYAFAAKEYRAYCGVADRCSRKWMTHNMKQSVNKIKRRKWLSKESRNLVPSSSAETTATEADQIENRQLI